MTSEPTATQALHGTPLTTDSNVSCEACTADLEPGDAITIKFHVHQDEWTPTAAYCSDCAPDTTDDHSSIVEGRLTTTIDPRTDTPVLTVATTEYDLKTLPLDTTVSGTDPSETGDHGPDPTDNDTDDPTDTDDPETTPNQDPSPEPDRVLISLQSNRSDRVFHFDDGEGTPLCDVEGTFEAVPIDEASDHAPRACRNCEREHRGRQQERPCPHCGESIILTHWPRHVSRCSGPTQRRGDSDPATAADSNTETERDAPAEERPEQHARSESTTGSTLDSDSGPGPNPDPDPDSDHGVARSNQTNHEFVTKSGRPDPTWIGRTRPPQTTRHHPRTRTHPVDHTALTPRTLATPPTSIPPQRPTTIEQTRATPEKMSPYCSSEYNPSVRTRHSQLGTQQRRKGKRGEHPSLFGHWSKSYRRRAEAVAIRSRRWNRSTRGSRTAPASRSIDGPVVRRVAVRQRTTGQTMHAPSSGIRPRPPPMSSGTPRRQRHTGRPETVPAYGQPGLPREIDSAGRPGRPGDEPRGESAHRTSCELAVVSVLKDIFERRAGIEALFAAPYRRIAHRSPAIAILRDLHPQ